MDVDMEMMHQAKPTTEMYSPYGRGSEEEGVMDEEELGDESYEYGDECFSQQDGDADCGQDAEEQTVEEFNPSVPMHRSCFHISLLSAAACMQVAHCVVLCLVCGRRGLSRCHSK